MFGYRRPPRVRLGRPALFLAAAAIGLPTHSGTPSRIGVPPHPRPPSEPTRDRPSRPPPLSAEGACSAAVLDHAKSLSAISDEDPCSLLPKVIHQQKHIEVPHRPHKGMLHTPKAIVTWPVGRTTPRFKCLCLVPLSPSVLQKHSHLGQGRLAYSSAPKAYKESAFFGETHLPSNHFHPVLP